MMNDAEQIAVLRTAFVAMLPQLRLADLHMGLMNHVSLENKARIALERSGDAAAMAGKRCEACRETGAVHCADPANCGGPWDARAQECRECAMQPCDDCPDRNAA